MTVSDVDLSPIEPIRNALLNISGSERTGAQLRALIDWACPKFDLRAAAGVPIGSGALTKFLNQNFGDIVRHVGKHGGDNLYSIGPSQSAPQPTTVASRTGEEPNLWAVFASPGLHQQVVLDRATGRTFGQPQGSPLSENQIAIPPVTHDEFHTLAEAFAQSCPPDLKQGLEEILIHPQFIYDNWMSILRDKYPSQHHRWGLFRVQGIIDLFRKRLEQTGIPDDQREAVVNRMREAQSAKFKERLLGRTRYALYSTPTSWERRDVHEAGSLATYPARESGASLDARSAAILAVENMSISEIRRLTIPLDHMSA